MQRPTRPLGANDLLKQQTTRVERMVAFVAAVARPLREEFDLFWRPGGLRLPGDRQAAFKAQVEALLAKLEAGEALLASLRVLGPNEALTALSQYEANGLIAAASGVEALARRLRQEPAVQGAVLQSAQPARTTAPLGNEGENVMQMLRRLVAPQGTRPLAGTTARTSPLPDTAPEQAAFEAAFKLVDRVLEYCAPRLGVVEVALTAAGVPGKRRPWREVEAGMPAIVKQYEVPKPRTQWLFSLTRLVYANPEAARRAHVAVVQWQAARALMDEADLVRRSLASLPPERQLALLRQFNVGKFRASVFPLGNLHMSFKGTPLLQDLFPAPERKA